MEKEYIQRRNPPVGRSNRPRRPNNRRKSGPPPFIYLALALIVIIVVIVLIVVFASRGGKDPEPGNVSGSSSSMTSSGPLSSDPASQPQSSGVSSQPSNATPPPEKVPSGDLQKLDALVQIGDTGYEYYNFVEDRANKYITTVCDAGEQLGSIKLYNMIIPTSMDVMLPESYIEENGINSQDQNKAIHYMYSSINTINPNVKTVPIFDALKLHNNEYIYFRTDHHWTQLGAYYAYVEFCKAKGVEAVALDQFEKKEYPGFLGSFYNDSPNTEMENNPDTVEAYVSSANTTMYYTTEDGETYEQPVIADGSGYSSEWLYLIFAAGDQPYEEIVNSDLTNGSSCLVVKESFGNAFVPFLVNHYQTVYVVDYRSYEGDISALAEEKGVDDVLLLNNISMTRNEDLIDELSNRF